MNIHEYQSKEILKKYNMMVLEGHVVDTVDDAVVVAKRMGGPVWVVKAQIHAGGRGKGGGVKLAKSIEEVKSYAEEILGMTLVTPQTGPEGKLVNKVLIEQGCRIKKEYYVAVLIDRSFQKVIMMASSEGGMDIEEVAEKTPELIHKVAIDPLLGLTAFQARQLAFNIGMQGAVVNKAVKSFLGLYKAFEARDGSIAEINPLVETEDGEVVVLDAKFGFDSNSLYRQADIVKYRDFSEEDSAEVEASKNNLAFIKLDGNIGCLVNGAGLAMATMDIIKICGGSPANFLDVGGGADRHRVTEAFKIILQDKNVKGILVNIFGGIMKCDIIAEGIVAAIKALGLSVPLVVRLEGTNVEKGKKILSESGLNIISAGDLGSAAKKIVSAVEAL